MKYNSKNAETLAKKQKSEIPFSDWDDNLVFFFFNSVYENKEEYENFCCCSEPLGPVCRLGFTMCSKVVSGRGCCS